MRETKDIWFLLKGQRTKTTLLLVLTLFNGCMESMSIVLIMPIFQALLGSAHSGRFAFLIKYLETYTPAHYTVVTLTGVMVGLIVIKAGTQLSEYALSASIFNKVYARIIQKIFKNYLCLDYGQIIARKQGDMMHQLSTEPEHVYNTFLSAGTIYSRIAFVGLVTVSLVIISWKVALACALFFGGILSLSQALSSRYSNQLGGAQSVSQRDIGQLTSETIAGIRQVKVFVQERRQLNRLATLVAALRKSRMKFIFMQNVPYVLNEFFMVAFVAIVISYLFFVAHRRVAELIPVLAVFVIAGKRMATDIAGIMQQWMMLRSQRHSIARVCQHMRARESEAKEVLDRGKPLAHLNEDITLEHLDFSYPGRPPLFSDYSMVLKHGKITALIGSSGSGKSTIADLLTRLYQPTGGCIRHGKTPIEAYSLASWRARIGFVSQDTFIFNTSIFENIKLGYPEATDKALYEAARRAHIHEFIESLPEGYHTQVGDRGVKLSGGQRQRLAIARVILRQPDMYIFDEATSALDNETEAAIMDDFLEIARGKTTLIIAHRLSTIESADYVYRLGDSVQPTHTSQSKETAYECE